MRRNCRQSPGLAASRVILRAHSAMVILIVLAHSGIVAMLPVQWAWFPLTRDTLQVIHAREALPAPDIVMIRRPHLPLTPTAEFPGDVLLRGQTERRAMNETFSTDMAPMPVHLANEAFEPDKIGNDTMHLGADADSELILPICNGA